MCCPTDDEDSAPALTRCRTPRTVERASCRLCNVRRRGRHARPRLANFPRSSPRSRAKRAHNEGLTRETGFPRGASGGARRVAQSVGPAWIRTRDQRIMSLPLARERPRRCEAFPLATGVSAPPPHRRLGLSRPLSLPPAWPPRAHSSSEDGGAFKGEDTRLGESERRLLRHGPNRRLEERPPIGGRSSSSVVVRRFRYPLVGQGFAISPLLKLFQRVNGPVGPG